MPHLKLDAHASQVSRDPSKPTIMVVSDSAAVHSGFAQVVRNVFKRLWDTQKYNIVQFGWWHINPLEAVPWDIIITERDPADRRPIPAAQLAIDPRDKYGEISFARTVESVRPDLVWVMGDPWMITSVLTNPHRHSYRCMAYMPVDGAPLATIWSVINHADVVVPYLPWGKKMMERWVPEAKGKIVAHIPHGVDTKTYFPMEGKVRDELRAINGTSPDDILMLSVSRNQGRKNLPALIELTYYIRSGDYRVCTFCGRAYRNPYDYRAGRPTGEKASCNQPECIAKGHEGEMYMREGKPNPHFVYYMHTPILDLEQYSWQLLDVLDAFNLGEVPEDDPEDVRYPGFRWQEHLHVVHGVPEQELAMLYASADIFALPTTGEGFGLPIIEAMSCGTPVVVPNVSSHPDFVREGGGLLVDIGYNICEPLSQYWRGYPDMDDYLTKVLRLVEDAELRKSMGKAARETALRYDWSTIAKQWENLIDAQLSEFMPARPWLKLTMV